MVTLVLKRKRLKHMGHRQARRNLQRRKARGHWILAVQKTIRSRLKCFSTSLSFKPGLFVANKHFFLFHTMFAIMVQFIHETVLWTTMHVFYDQSYSCFWVVCEMALHLKKFPSIKLVKNHWCCLCWNCFFVPFIYTCNHYSLQNHATSQNNFQLACMLVMLVQGFQKFFGSISSMPKKSVFPDGTSPATRTAKLNDTNFFHQARMHTPVGRMKFELTPKLAGFDVK